MKCKVKLFGTVPLTNWVQDKRIALLTVKSGVIHGPVVIAGTVHILPVIYFVPDSVRIFGRNIKGNASSGNRTRAARVAGEHSTTEPTMLDAREIKCKLYIEFNNKKNF